MSSITHTLALMILSFVSEKTKLVRRMKRNVFISIIENRNPIQDWKNQDFSTANDVINYSMHLRVDPRRK